MESKTNKIFSRHQCSVHFYHTSGSYLLCKQGSFVNRFFLPIVVKQRIDKISSSLLGTDANSEYLLHVLLSSQKVCEYSNIITLKRFATFIVWGNNCWLSALLTV